MGPPSVSLGRSRIAGRYAALALGMICRTMNHSHTAWGSRPKACASDGGSRVGHIARWRKAPSRDVTDARKQFSPIAVGVSVRRALEVLRLASIIRDTSI